MTTTRTPKIAQAVMAPSAMTTPAQLERLGEHLRKLRLEALLQHTAAQELPYAEFLEQVLGEEVAATRRTLIATKLHTCSPPHARDLAQRVGHLRAGRRERRTRCHRGGHVRARAFGQRGVAHGVEGGALVRPRRAALPSNQRTMSSWHSDSSPPNAAHSRE
ncbi:hypothetical protein LJR039_006017 [Pseudorhodoferax sp. LjRoot39]|uniref:hypothetical protein n=1 Tax=Pseudorhodoferax sp. LjRoot39 TaxID=3342328 RepID=UPI003ECCB48C